MIVYRCLLLYIIAHLLCFNLQVYATGTINLSEKPHALYATHLEIAEETGTEHNLTDIQKKVFRSVTTAEMTSNGELKLNPQKTLWIRFTIAAHRDPYLLEFLDFNLHHLTFYSLSGNQLVTFKPSGLSLPFDSRSLQHKNLSYQLSASTLPTVCYVRVQPGNSTVLSAVFKSYESFIHYALTEYLLLGLFYGIIAVMILYSFILFVTLREKYYAYYIFYAACMAMVSLCHDGLGFQYLWPHHPEWNRLIQVSAQFGLVIWALVYAKWFLNTKAIAPMSHRLINLLIGGISLLYLTVLIVRPVQSEYLIALAVIPFSLIYQTAFVSYRKGFRPSSFFLLAFGFFFLGYIVRMLTYFGWIDNSIIAVYSYNVGVLLELIFFSIATGDKIKTVQEDREYAYRERDSIQQKIIEQLQENEKLRTKVNRELEEKIKERTQEIEEKNMELVEANSKLKALTDEANQWNIKLDLDNRRLQSEIKEVEKARILLKDVNFNEFSAVFPDERACLQYLAELKWQHGYCCKKCQNTSYGKSKTLFGRRCTKCNYDESPTTDTLFHRLRFPITKAFYLVYLVSTKDTALTVDELSEILSLRRETCWSFRKKILETKKNAKTDLKQTEENGWATLALVSVSQ